MAESDSDKTLEERREAEAADGGDPIALTLAMSAASRGLALDPRTAAYLEEQTRLTHLRANSIISNRAINDATLRVKHWSDILKMTFQVAAAFVALALGAGILALLISAIRTRNVVVDQFDTPPSFAARGLNGTVVAGGLLDKLTEMQGATRTSAVKRGISSAWTGDIKIQLPETGVSIGELQNILKEQLGHDVHIGGDLVQTLDGNLALTVRGSGMLSKTFEGPPDTLDALTTKAAEYIYSLDEPALYMSYLTQEGRDAEVVAFAKANYASARPDDKPYILNAWANSAANIGEPAIETLKLYREAVRLKPDFWVAYNNAINALWALGREEDAWRAGQLMLRRAGGRPGAAREILYQNPDVMTWNIGALRAGMIADANAHGGVGTGVAAEGPAIADADMRLHDFGDAEFQLKTAQGDATDPSVPAMGHFVTARIRFEQGDVAAAKEMDAFLQAYANPAVSSNYPGYTCWAAPIYEAAGQSAKADAVIAKGGSYVDCDRFEGDIHDHRGDWAGAQRAYRAAVTLAPDLPGGYYSWGLALARHGDATGAIRMLALANAKGPTWADPLKAWGDVLARQRDWKDARAKYEAAAGFAPAWIELQQARRVAAAHGV